MPVPKRRKTRSKRDMGRSHHHLRPLSLVECSNCHSPRLPHTVCPECGFYKGRQIIRPREA